MAKLETTRVKKAKGKKRKCTSVEEDEVANKSVIVEANVDDEPMQRNRETEPDICASKSKKRKNKGQGEILEKRSKTQHIDEDKKSERDTQNVGNTFGEPTFEELKESKKPENNLAIVTGRQKKKQKHASLLQTQKVVTLEKEKQRNAEYLNKWKYMRNSWKFEKLRQISIQQTIFEKDKLDSDIWPIALEYLAGSKGSAKEKIIKLANDAIEDIDKLCEQDSQNGVDSVRYQRARDLLQIFN